MLDNTTIKILSKVYTHSNEETYDMKKQISTYKAPKELKEKEKLAFENSGFIINTIKHYTHDDTLIRLRKIVDDNPHLEALTYNLLIKAVATGFHRGLQPIISYLFAKHTPKHTFVPLGDDEYNCNTCKICGLPKASWENDGKNLYDLYIGYCRIGGYMEALLDLEEVISFEPIHVSNEEIAIFKHLIDFIDNAPEKETPTELLMRISKEKILPKSNTISRTWLLRILAELGVMKNKLDPNYDTLRHFVSYEQKYQWELRLHDEAPNHRSEVNFPLSAWRGNLGINQVLVESIIATAKKGY